MTQCLACGDPTKTRREKHYRYTECGLPNVVIQDALNVATCERCGETYTSIPAIEGLHRQIAAAVIRKKGHLAPTEIRFLRKYLGWSAPTSPNARERSRRPSRGGRTAGR